MSGMQTEVPEEDRLAKTLQNSPQWHCSHQRGGWGDVVKCQLLLRHLRTQICGTTESGTSLQEFALCLGGI